MSLMISLLRGLLYDPEKEKQLALQRQRGLIEQRLIETYWHLALSIHAAVAEYHSQIKVHVPSTPRLLQGEDFQSMTACSYVLKRIFANTPNADGAVLKHEVAKVITDYLTACGYKKFRVLCEETTYEYKILVRFCKGFRLGKTMDARMGAISFFKLMDSLNTFGMVNTSGTYGLYFVRLYNGGTVTISQKSVLLVYRWGLWYKSGIALDDNGCPYLACFNEPLDNFVGCTVRI